MTKISIRENVSVEQLRAAVQAAAAQLAAAQQELSGLEQQMNDELAAVKAKWADKFTETKAKVDKNNKRLAAARAYLAAESDDPADQAPAPSAAMRPGSPAAATGRSLPPSSAGMPATRVPSYDPSSSRFSGGRTANAAAAAGLEGDTKGNILRILKDGPATITRLSRELGGIHMSTLQRALGDLQAKGVITKRGYGEGWALNEHDASLPQVRTTFGVAKFVSPSEAVLEGHVLHTFNVSSKAVAIRGAVVEFANGHKFDVSRPIDTADDEACEAVRVHREVFGG